MKKLFSLVLVCCALTVFAITVNDVYNGTLQVTVDGGTTSSNQNVTVTAYSGTSATLKIENFSFGNVWSGDAYVKVTLDATGKMTKLNSITAAGMTAFGTLDPDSSFINDTTCQISLNIWALTKTVKVNFVGSKTTK